MEAVAIIAGIFGLLVIGLFFKLTRLIIKSYNSGVKDQMLIFAVVINWCMPIVGVLMLKALEKDFEFFDWEYISSLYTWLFVSLTCFHVSFFSKEKIGPLLLAILPLGMIAGIILLMFMFIHLIPFILLATVFPFILIGFPALFIFPSIILFILQLKVHNFYIVKQSIRKGIRPDTKMNRMLIRISHFFPFVALVTSFQYLFGQKPESIVKTFTQSHEGIFAQGICEKCASSTNDYLCTIAAQGYPAIVKPIRNGVRLGMPIVVTRQLLISNAFEELIMMKFPRIHKLVRKIYDALNIPVNQWCRYKAFATVIYFLWKPFEWTGLVCIYLFVNNPEEMINRQYLENKTS